MKELPLGKEGGKKIIYMMHTGKALMVEGEERERERGTLVL